MPLLIKILGACFITVATTLFGISLSKGLKGRLHSLNWFIGAVDEISEKIRYSSAELPQIVRSIYSYENFLSVDEPFYVNIRDAHLNDDDKKTVNEFFAGLGLGDSESQVKRCAMYKRQLLRRLEDADKQYTDKSALYKKLGFLGGLGVAIILM